MSDELRDRIDRIISEVSGGQSSHQKHAQAIIDALGLHQEVEEPERIEIRRLQGPASIIRHTEPCQGRRRTRYVTKWTETE